MTRAPCFALVALLLTALVAGLACGGCEGSKSTGDPVDAGAVPDGEVDLTALTWNVGNAVREEDQDYALRIRSQAFEDHLAARLQERAPDLVALQELLAPEQCADFEETDPGRTCFGVDADPPPVRRILGPDYTIVCDQRLQSKCIGVHVGFGAVRGVGRGELAPMGAETPALPYEPCETFACEPGTDACAAQASVSSLLVDTSEGRTLRVVNVHAHPFGPPCRPEMVRQAFALVDEHPAILMGDWNFDPDDESESTEAWRMHVGEERRFRSHNPADDDQELIGTFPGDGRAIDLVVTDFAEGQCQVLADPPLDAGFDFEAAGIPEEEQRRPDHHAVLCSLSLSL